MIKRSSDRAGTPRSHLEHSTTRPLDHSLSRILVVQLTRLGDLLQTTPLISGLRHAHPRAVIAALVNKRFEKALAGHPDLDEIFLLDADFLPAWHAGNRDDFLSAHHHLSDLARSLRTMNFDWVINASFNDVSATLTRLLGAGRISGFVTRPDGLLDAPDFVSRYFHSEIQGSHFPQLHVADVMQCLGGIAPRGKPYTTPTRTERGRWAAEFLRSRGVASNETLIGIQPGSNSQKKGLPPEYVAAIVGAMTGRADLKFVILGSQQEREHFGQIQRQSTTPLIDATGIEWLELSALVPRLDFLLSGDTAPAHLACAGPTCVVTVFRGESHYSVTGPYGTGHWTFDPPQGSTDLPRIEAVAPLLVALSDGSEPTIPADALGGWKLFRSEFGADGWQRYVPHSATILSGREQVGSHMLEWWKRLLLNDGAFSPLQRPGATREVPVPPRLPEDLAEPIRSTLTQAEVLLQETVLALSTANGEGSRIMENNDRLLERLDSEAPAKLVTPLLSLVDSEKRLIFEQDPANARSATINAYRRLQERLVDLRDFLTS